MSYKKQKPISQKDIANLAGVSRSSVSYILNERGDSRFSPDVRQKVLRIAEQLGYRPNPFGIGLKTQVSKNILLLITSLSDASMTILIKAVEKAAVLQGYGLLIYNMEDIYDKTFSSNMTLFDKPFDGVLYCYPDNTDSEIIDFLSNKFYIPTVIIGNKLKTQSLDNVRYDYFEAGRKIAEYINDIGHKKVAIILSDLSKNILSKNLRIEGMKIIFSQNNIKVDIIQSKMSSNERSLFFDIREYDMGFETGLEIVDRGLEYTAIIGTNDFISVGIMNALKSRGVKIPEQVSIASFGGLLVSEVVEPKLTLIELPTYRIGEIAFNTLIERIKKKESYEPKETIVESKLIVRGSTSESKTFIV